MGDDGRGLSQSIGTVPVKSGTNDSGMPVSRDAHDPGEKRRPPTAVSKKGTSISRSAGCRSTRSSRSGDSPAPSSWPLPFSGFGRDRSAIVCGIPGLRIDCSERTCSYAEHDRSGSVPAKCSLNLDFHPSTRGYELSLVSRENSFPPSRCGGGQGQACFSLATFPR
jgi:hypothetical protein